MSLKPKAFSYLRVSGLGQVSGDGFRRQADAIRRYARAAGFDIVREFREPISGTSDLEDRPELTAALNAIAENGVRVVLIEHADRIARDAFIQESIVRQFQGLSARLVTADGVDLTDDSSISNVMTRQIFASIAQHDKQRLVRKLRSSRAEIRNARGFCEGRRPYGWREGERATLDRMLALRRRAWSYGRIARALNTEGIFNREGRPWSASRIQAIAKQAAKIDAIVRTASRVPRRPAAV